MSVYTGKIDRATGAGASLGARRAWGLVAGDLVWGLAFGALARTSGLTLPETAAMSGIVFAGTAQMAALALWTPQVAALPVLGIVLTTFVVNLRHLMLGVALAPWFGTTSARRAYAAIFFLTDETWALTAAERARQQVRPGARDGQPDPARAPGVAFLTGSGVAFWVAWVGASAAGHLAGGAVRDPARWALDFAAVAAIIVLLHALWRGRGDVLPWVTAAVVSVGVSLLVAGSWYILAGAVAGSVVGALATGRAPVHPVHPVPEARPHAR